MFLGGKGLFWQQVQRTKIISSPDQKSPARFHFMRAQSLLAHSFGRSRAIVMDFLNVGPLLSALTFASSLSS